MLQKFRNLIARLVRLYPKQQVVIITDSEECVCHYFKDIIDDFNHAEVIHITNLDAQISQRQLKKIGRNRNLLFFIHGDKQTLRCFMNKTVNSRETQEFIHCNWWQLVEKNLKHVYFHVCYGSEIIDNCFELSSNFKNWVSYSGKLNAVISHDPKLKEINRRFLSTIIELVRDKLNVNSLATSIMSAYMTMQSALYEDNRPIDGFSGFIADIGSNVRKLTHSQQ